MLTIAGGIFLAWLLIATLNVWLIPVLRFAGFLLSAGAFVIFLVLISVISGG